MKSQITVALPADLSLELRSRSYGQFGALTVIVKDALRAYFAANPMSDEQRQILQIILNRDAAKAAPEPTINDKA